MKINGKHELLVQIAQRGLLLAALLAMVLICANPGRAQSSATTAPAQDAKLAPAPAVPTQMPATIANPASAQAKPVSPEEKPSAKGAKEGIVVHGHWIIVVKNPDGTVAARQEFENTLDPIEGADLLTGLLSGVYTTSGFIIDLNAPGGTICGGPDCLIHDSRNSYYCANGNPCLTYTANTGTANNNANGFTLSGNVTLAKTDGGIISLVSTGIHACIPDSSLIINTAGTGLRPGSTPATDVVNAAATSSFAGTAPGLPSSPPTCGIPPFTTQLVVPLLLTSRAITQPVTGGQSVAVTVVITFSGS